MNYVHQFCVGAAKGVLSPFVLQEIIMESLQRLNPAHVHNHLRTPAFHQLVQRCQQAYIQVCMAFLLNGESWLLYLGSFVNLNVLPLFGEWSNMAVVKHN